MSSLNKDSCSFFKKKKKDFSCRIKQVQQLTSGGVALNLLALEVLSCSLLWSSWQEHEGSLDAPCAQSLATGGVTYAGAGPVLSAFYLEEDFLESDETLVVLITPGSYRGKCIGIEVSGLSEVDLKTYPAAFSGVLDSTFHFPSGLRPLNQQIMNSDIAGKWVK